MAFRNRNLSPCRMRPREFTYRELLAMEQAGILGEDERVELLHGSIVPMTVNPASRAGRARTQ